MDTCTYCGEVKHIVRRERFADACTDCEYMLDADAANTKAVEEDAEATEWMNGLSTDDPDFEYLNGEWLNEQ